jgi:hypothetical protein
MGRRLQAEKRMLSSVSGIKSSRVMVANGMFAGNMVERRAVYSLIRRKGSRSVGTAARRRRVVIVYYLRNFAEALLRSCSNNRPRGHRVVSTFPLILELSSLPTPQLHCSCTPFS